VDDNRNFDQAVARMVDRTRMLATGLTLSSADGRILTMSEAAPAGAVELERRQQRAGKIGGGVLAGAISGLILSARRFEHDACVAVPACEEPARLGATPRPLARSHALEYGLTGAAAGGLLGWLWASTTEP
jgi:hypothetical protein